MKKKIALAFALVLCLSLLGQTACAFAPVPFADSYFDSATISLSSSMKASFSALTSYKSSKIQVTSCTLQRKNGNTWNDVATLTPPSTVATNAYSYRASSAYSSAATSGYTYRVWAVFNADGHTVTRYSNSVAY